MYGILALSARTAMQARTQLRRIPRRAGGKIRGWDARLRGLGPLPLFYGKRFLSLSGSSK